MDQLNMGCILFALYYITGALFFSYTCVCQEVSYNGTLCYNEKVTITCWLEHKDSSPASWYLVQDGTKTKMTQNCAIQPAGKTILSDSPNCKDGVYQPANLEFNIDHLDLERDLNKSWFCSYNGTHYIDINSNCHNVTKDKIHIDVKDVQGNTLHWGDAFTLGINIDCAYPPLPVTWCIIAMTDGDTGNICDGEPGFSDYFDGNPEIQQIFSSCEDAYETDIVKSLESTFMGKFAKNRDKRDTKIYFEISVNDITLTIESNGKPIFGYPCAGCWAAPLIAVVTIIVAIALVALVIAIVVVVKQQKKKIKENNTENHTVHVNNLPAGVPIEEIPPDKARPPPKNPY